METKFNQCLQETYDLFKSQGISITGEGIKEVITNPNLFESYVMSMTSDITDADHQAEMTQLFANSNEHLLESTGVMGIAPVSAMTFPVIKKLWPSIALKNAVKCGVAKSPSFMYNWMRPYYITVDASGNEVRHYVPRPGMLGADATTDFTGDYITKDVTLVSGAGSVDFGTSVSQSASLIKQQGIDADFTLVSVDGVVVNKKAGIEPVVIADIAIHYNEAAVTAGTTVVTGGTYYVLKNNEYYKLTEADKNSDYADADGKAKAGVKFFNQVAAGSVIVRIDFNNGTAKVIGIDGCADKKVVLRAHRNVAYNEVTTSWDFDIEREDIRIGTGEHYNTPLTIEKLTDLKAMYSIDGTKTAVEIMTKAMALNTDKRLLNFLKDEYLNQPGQSFDKMFEFEGYPKATKYTGKFDVKPMPGYAGGAKAWREELKPVIDHVAARIKQQTFLGPGIFNIVANPLDTMLITNVDWAYRGGQQSVDGVTVNYSTGTYSNASYTYKIVSTEIVPQGVMYLVFIPEAEDEPTYNYWAYSFSTELGYRDPHRANVPSVMLCKRDVMKAFIPAIGAIIIENNDGDENYDPFREYVATKAM